MKYICFTLLSILFSPFCFANYLIGTGMYDITGPAAEVGMIGYAKSITQHRHKSLTTRKQRSTGG